MLASKHTQTPLPAVQASFNATGSHLAVVLHKQVFIHETEGFKRVMTFQWFEEWQPKLPGDQYFKWSKVGARTAGILIFKIDQGVVFEHGDLAVGDAGPAGPFARHQQWDCQVCLIPHSTAEASQKFESLHLSPNLTRVFIVSTAGTRQPNGSNPSHTLAAVYDTYDGQKLWEEKWEELSILVYHGVNYNALGMSSEQIVINWKNGKVLFKGSRPEANGHGFSWNWAGTHFAFGRGMHLAGDPELCVCKLTAGSPPKWPSTRAADDEWTVVSSCRTCEVQPEAFDSSPWTFVRFAAWSPGDRWLAMIYMR
ncbi:hypothetical protein WJX73_008585 [Symbiochloris irregularis]|uniref:Uncharacterized protein n=1 Tax=Symbiochloris irregularis TaxID=706552 RepID=A0AAW1NSJ3_9CHLO